MVGNGGTAWLVASDYIRLNRSGGPISSDFTNRGLFVEKGRTMLPPRLAEMKGNSLHGSGCHLNYINSEFQVHYSRERLHEARGSRPSDWADASAGLTPHHSTRDALLVEARQHRVQSRAGRLTSDKTVDASSFGATGFERCT
jgi:hypothetical protein